ncbi:ABC transporter substrate-binding protein [Gulosibacter chungangensis]|uniref:ABC transporter substrate-binding protein n=1 Tax=Gulosibacter chungangensis TaxID=979746 RepID=A0A7J5BFP7_9MICO|nr:ABC transporter substrate-binding protein [Gulosibacter chungangensis]KAB1645101.1 ABC transporter substrate-binding protein [Gulosibacter chungangensis]
MKIQRRRLSGASALGAVAAIAALVLTGCAGSPSASETSGAADGELPVVQIGITPSVNNATMNLAVDAEFGDAHGVRLERTTVGGAGSTNQVSALLAGDIDVGVGGTNTIIDAIAQGSDIQIIAGMAPLLFSLTLTDDAAEASGVSPDAPIEERIQALKGLKIAVSPSGSTGNTVLRTILADYGLDADSDVTFVPLNDLGAVPAGLMQGTYDASFAAVGTGEVAVASGDAVTWVSLPQGDIPSFEPYVGIVAYSSKSYIEEHPDEIAAVFAALNDAQQMTVNEPDGVASILKQSIFAEMDDSVFEATWSQVQDSYTEGSQFTEENWNTIVTLFDATSENDYASLNYEDIVAEIARG